MINWIDVATQLPPVHFNVLVFLKNTTEMGLDSFITEAFLHKNDEIDDAYKREWHIHEIGSTLKQESLKGYVITHWSLPNYPS